MWLFIIFHSRQHPAHHLEIQHPAHHLEIRKLFSTTRYQLKTSPTCRSCRLWHEERLRSNCWLWTSLKKINKNTMHACVYINREGKYTISILHWFDIPIKVIPIQWYRMIELLRSIFPVSYSSHECNISWWITLWKQPVPMQQPLHM